MGAEPWATNVPEKELFVAQRLEELEQFARKTSVGALAYGDVWLGEKRKTLGTLMKAQVAQALDRLVQPPLVILHFDRNGDAWFNYISFRRCGTVELRPTFGQVPRTGCMPLCPSLDKLDPFVGMWTTLELSLKC